MFDIKATLSEYGLTEELYESLLKDCSDKMEKISDLDWGEIAEKYGIDWNGDSLRKAQQPPLVGGAFIKQYYDEKYINKSCSDDDDYMEQLKTMKREIQKERTKLQTEKLEYNKWLREESRDELITEKIIEAINNVKNVEVPKYIEPIKGEKSYILALADCHYGIEFDIKDLFGNTINSYSPEIFEKRMWDLYNQVRAIVEKESINELSVWELGDGIQGLLRLNSQLMQLRYGVIDSAINYGHFLGVWLNELSKIVRIKFQMTMDSNHNQLRLCGAPKNSFVDENMSKVIMLALKEILKDNPNVEIIENPTGMNFGEFSSYQILGIHGEVKNLANALDDYSRAYNTNISYIIGAHKHHLDTKEVGIGAEALGIRSMIGVDPYGMSLTCTSNAGASLFEFNNDGLVCDHRLVVK